MDVQKATKAHITQVADNLNFFIQNLAQRAIDHDRSKLESPEKEVFKEWTPELAAITYGSKEYEDALQKMKPAIIHHYANNRHHPEFGSMSEKWRPLVDYEGLYEISNRGRVKSLHRSADRPGRGDTVTIKESIRKFNVTPKGYARLQLYDCNGKAKNKFVHVLVAETFHGPKPSERHQSNHKDGIKLNNYADNIEWMTPGENLQHAYNNGLRSCKYVVSCPDLDLVTMGVTKMKESLLALGYDKARDSAILAVCNGESKHHMGFKFTADRIQEFMVSDINDMNLIDIVEMFCDWIAAAERHNDRDPIESLRINVKRFDISPQLEAVFKNTIKAYFSRETKATD